MVLQNIYTTPYWEWRPPIWEFCLKSSGYLMSNGFVFIGFPSQVIWRAMRDHQWCTISQAVVNQLRWAMGVCSSSVIPIHLSIYLPSSSPIYPKSFDEHSTCAITKEWFIPSHLTNNEPVVITNQWFAPSHLMSNEPLVITTQWFITSHLRSNEPEFSWVLCHERERHVSCSPPTTDVPAHSQRCVIVHHALIKWRPYLTRGSNFNRCSPTL